MIIWGEIAYEAFRHQADGVSPTNGLQLPVWEVLSPNQQAAWGASAQAVRQTCINLIGVDHGEPVNEDNSEPAPGVAMQSLHEWIEGWRTQWAVEGKGTLVEEHSVPGNGGLVRFVYMTDRNRYQIVARPSGVARSYPDRMPFSPNRVRDRGYLGAQASRINGGGRDLADGPLNEATWRAIVSDIQDFEAGAGRFGPSPE